MKEIERRIIRAAEVLFAERGFEVTWAEISAATDLPPTILRRHFRNKSFLVAKVLARLVARRWRPEWDALLANRAAPLERRLIRFFAEYATHGGRIATRLSMRVAVSPVYASSRAAVDSSLARRVLLPIIRELRYELDLPPPHERSVLAGELELVQMICGAVAYPNLRLHVFGMPVHVNLAELSAMMVRAWLPGARAEIKRLHGVVAPAVQPAPLLATMEQTSIESRAIVQATEEAACE